LKTSWNVCGITGGQLESLVPIAVQREHRVAAAAGRTGPVAGVSKAMPPIRMETSDWVCTLRRSR